ncbi:MAG: TonB-dependent receptor [Bacteroidetes bacterium]|nr:TonB-dependent receptor [Bacteroidota bacterium]MBS1757498.1 TonB-dependent receptor [Bacteroidota bacterium]
MKKQLSTLLLATISLCSYAQNAGKITGTIRDGGNQKIIDAASVSLLHAKDSGLIKISLVDKEGNFSFENIKEGNYLVVGTSVGHTKVYSNLVTVSAAVPSVQVGTLQLMPIEKSLSAVTVVAKRPMIEVKADKIVFNVENSINATGSNAMELLQKSPGVVVDNNDNISMKGKSGVKIYIDGKLTQMDTKSLADYLRGINSTDIESIEMIANPSAKYDASGNAGIINIKLKKNKSYGTNGNASLGFIQGITPKGNGSVSLNYRNKKVNVFSNFSGNIGNRDNDLDIYRVQNDTIYDQHTRMHNIRRGLSAKAGIDFFANKKSTYGFLVTSYLGGGSFNTNGSTKIYDENKQLIKTLVATNSMPGNRNNTNFNVNYRFADTSGKEISFDGDYGLFRSTGSSYQPNYYYDVNDHLLQTKITGNNTPTDIDIYTAKLDVEQKFWKGKIGYGAKFSYVKTRNSLDYFDYGNSGPIKNLGQSNRFVYSENVNASYLNYNRQFNTKWSLQAGVRAEQTNSEGLLTRGDGAIQADNNVKKSYLDFFPSAALSFNVNEKNSFGLTYSRRIDRPDYQDLNPFENKLDELTYEKGNAFLRPQYTNSVELSHTFKSKLTTTLGYSYVKDYATQVTDTVGNATYVQQQNIATQKIYSANISSPLNITKWWTGYANIWYNFQQLNGTYNNVVVNVNASSYGAYMQQSFLLGKNYKAELSGWFNGPGLESVWKHEAMGGLDAGIQKQFMKNKATVKLAVTDIFRTTKFKAYSNLGNTVLNINQQNENQTVRISFNYRFGNSQVKAARQRNTGLESEGNRIK